MKRGERGQVYFLQRKINLSPLAVPFVPFVPLVGLFFLGFEFVNCHFAFKLIAGDEAG